MRLSTIPWFFTLYSHMWSIEYGDNANKSIWLFISKSVQLSLSDIQRKWKNVNSSFTSFRTEPVHTNTQTLTIHILSFAKIASTCLTSIPVTYIGPRTRARPSRTRLNFLWIYTEEVTNYESLFLFLVLVLRLQQLLLTNCGLKGIETCFNVKIVKQY